MKNYIRHAVPYTDAQKKLDISIEKLHAENRNLLEKFCNWLDEREAARRGKPFNSKMIDGSFNEEG